jgi:outer membrane protein assembly factor BamB
MRRPARLWIRRYDGPDHADDAAVDLALNAVAARLFVAAASCEPSPGVVCHTVTLAYDAVTGTRLWVRRLDVDSEPAKLAVSPDGARIFVTGDRFSTNSADYKTIAYSATDGSTLWSRTYDGPAHGQDDAFDVAPNPDGSAVIVTGHSLGANGRFDYTTIA